jgi:hypothetical protein
MSFMLSVTYKLDVLSVVMLNAVAPYPSVMEEVAGRAAHKVFRF